MFIKINKGDDLLPTLDWNWSDSLRSVVQVPPE